MLHTANPVTGQKGELLGEVVVGMGEALVGNQPGRALSFSAGFNGSSPDVSLLSLPSKRAGLFSPEGVSNVIFRSDSNGEDLEAFAGAGEIMKCCPHASPSPIIHYLTLLSYITIDCSQCLSAYSLELKHILPIHSVETPIVLLGNDNFSRFKYILRSIQKAIYHNFWPSQLARRGRG